MDSQYMVSIGGQFKLTIYLAQLLRYWGHNLDLFESRDIINHVTSGLNGLLYEVFSDQHSVLHDC